MTENKFDTGIIGGGIVGCALAYTLCTKYRTKTVLFEAEKELAFHQSGNNSGVVHSGIYYRPGSLKASNCASGREMMYRFCEDKKIAHEKCGKVIVATNEKELSALFKLKKKGEENGLLGLVELNQSEIENREPFIRGVRGLYVPHTGIVDFKAVTEAFARISRQNGSSVLTNCRVHNVRSRGECSLVETPRGKFEVGTLINCAGLESDRVARMCGVKPDLRIVPFRGEYYRFKPERSHMVKNLVYPVPNASLPFLGVHFTRMTDGDVEAGPNAVPAFSRQGYSRFSFSIKDMASTLSYGGFWKLAARYWRVGATEIWRSASKTAFVRELKKLMPDIEAGFLQKGGQGVRAQALSANGDLMDDFRIITSGSQIHVLNAPSPAATASLAIAEKIARKAVENIDIDK